MVRRIKKKSIANVGRKQNDSASRQTFIPPRFRYIFGGLFIIEALFMCWALCNQFIPSDWWYSLGLKINIVLSVLGIGVFIYTFWLNPHALDNSHTKFKKWLGILGAPLLIYFIGYFAVIYGLGDAFSQLYGKTATMEDVFEKKFVESRRGCQNRLYGYSLKGGFPAFFCSNPEVFTKLPKHVAVKIIGLESQAGFHLDTIEFDWLKTSFLPIEN